MINYFDSSSVTERNHGIPRTGNLSGKSRVEDSKTYECIVEFSFSQIHILADNRIQ